MNRHQVLSGAVNSGDHTFATGAVDGLHFTAYASGTSIVIVDGKFDRVQIIPFGSNQGGQLVLCVDCSHCTGKVAAACGNTVQVFEPVPPRPEEEQKCSFGYTWKNAGTITAESSVTVLSWNHDGSRLLTGGQVLQLWQVGTGPSHVQVDDFYLDQADNPPEWTSVWHARPACAVTKLAFSPDGAYFASFAQNDRLVKIWYENRTAQHQLMRNDSMSPKKEELHFSFIYVRHPRAVTGFSWRRTSVYMPRGVVGNVLITSCCDNVCRIWSETQVNTGFLGDHKRPSTGSAAFQNSLMLHATQPRGSIPGRKKPLSAHASDTSIDSSNVHDNHKFNSQMMKVPPVVHFHLAGNINLSTAWYSRGNSATDIPLLTSSPEAERSCNFVVHWLNNKELQLATQAQKLVQELQGNSDRGQQGAAQDSETDGSQQPPTDLLLDFGQEIDRNTGGGGDQNKTGADERKTTEDKKQQEVERCSETLLREWQHSPDMLFSVHPIDGSFLVWLVEWLDGSPQGGYRQAQISFSSRIPQALPLGDAVSMQPTLLMYYDLDHTGPMTSVAVKVKGDHKTLQPSPGVFMVTHHMNGSLNLWQVNFVEASSFSTVLSINPLSRVCGHRFPVDSVTCHPALPLLLTTSHQDLTNKNHMEGQPPGREPPPTSELLLWRVEPVGPLSKGGGMMELTRLHSPEPTAFTHTAWVPTLLPSWMLGQECNSPSVLFVTAEGSTLCLYLAVIDARTLLPDLAMQRRNEVVSLSSTPSSSSGCGTDLQNCSSGPVVNQAVSLQSGHRPGCILALDTIAHVNKDWQEIKLLHVFHHHLIAGRGTPVKSTEDHYHLVAVGSRTDGATVLRMWKITVAHPEESSVSQSSTGHGDDGVSSQMAAPSTLNLRPRFSISTTVECDLVLTLPHGVHVTMATVSAGHLSSASIYPAFMSPYLICTTCSDRKVRFWTCENEAENEGSKFTWTEWDMLSSDGYTAIDVPGKPFAASCAYSGRVAVAFQNRGSKHHHHHHHHQGDKPSRPSSLWVSIYECESTGGSEWCKEDTIGLHTGGDRTVKPQLAAIGADGATSTLLVSPGDGRPAVIQSVSPTSVSVPVLAPESSNTVLLDWAPTEDGSHLLTVAIDSKILIYAPVSEEVAEAASGREHKPKPSPARGLLQKSKSVTMVSSVDQIQWIKLRSIDLSQKEDMPAAPSRLSWVRDGLLVLGVDTEIHVYTQWQQLSTSATTDITSEDSTANMKSISEKALQRVASGTSLSSVMGTSKSFKRSVSTNSMRLAASTTGISKLFEGRDTMRKRDIRPELKKDDSLNSMQLIQECGLFEAAKLANPVLPQYHPKQLIELLNFGKMRRVKAILLHLVRCVAGYDSNSPFRRESENRPRAHSRTISLSGSSPMEPDTIPGEVTLDYVEIIAIPPLPLYSLVEADKEETVGTETALDMLQQDPMAMFSSDDPSKELSRLYENDDVFMHQESTDEEPPMPGGKKKKFGAKEARLLSKYLTHMHLPGLSSLDQMYLAALADTVANTKLDAMDTSTGQTHTQSDFSDFRLKVETLDDCGMRYMLAMRHHVYLMKMLPLGQRVQLQKQGLQPANFVWAFHSEGLEELINLIPGMVKGEPTWAELRQLGVGWWLRNTTILRLCIEKVAKTAFQSQKDPLDAALFYLAMKKKNVLWGLFRSVSDTKMVQFFRNNFSEDRWRRAALKNAFALLGRQRFEHAVAFFLLAGNLRDALEVCLNKMNDIQLAIIITRLYESELDDRVPANLVRILREECLGCVQQDDEPDPSRGHPDPFIRSMSYWMLKDYNMAVKTLLDQGTFNVSRLSPDPSEGASDVHLPSVFNFYTFLRSHPLVVRQKLLEKTPGGTSIGLTGQSQAAVSQVVTPVERRLFFTTAHAHLKAGCPALALEVLAKLPKKSLSQPAKTAEKVQDVAKTTEKPTGGATAGSVDWSTPTTAAAPSAGDIFSATDWSTPVSLQQEEDKLDLDWGSDHEEHAEDEDEDKTPTESTPAAAIATDTDSAEDDAADTDSPGQPDIMAQHLKFVACLKILMEELSTLATGFEVDGSQLRFQLYIWLEKCVECLQVLCHYVPEVEEEDDENDRPDRKRTESQTSDGTQPPSKTMGLHEIILMEKMDFDAKLERLSRRKLWLRANQQLLRTLLSYSELHGACGGGLASVRMELILLLQELQQNRPSRQLSAPLPLPTTLPLLSASIARSKTVVADPIRHLQSSTQEILRMLVTFTSPPTLSVPLKNVMLLRDLCAALSSCIYQSLCDVDAFRVSVSGESKVGLEGFTNTNVVYQESYLNAGARHTKRSSSAEDTPNLPAAKWPGVNTLRAVLSREKDEDAPKLQVLLCESLVAVYMSLLTYAMTLYDANILYRIVAHTWTEKMWPAVFGGGLEKVVSLSGPKMMQGMGGQDEMAKHRMRLNMKIMGSMSNGSPTGGEQRANTVEKFVSPEVSILSYIMAKPFVSKQQSRVDYDSAESSDEEDEDETDDAATQEKMGFLEHLDPHSYSWRVLRYAIIRFVSRNLRTFLPQVGIDIPELPVSSPLLHDILGILEKWEADLLDEVESMDGPPDDFIPGCYPDPMVLPSEKYKAMLDPSNTPFLSTSYSALPVKRLWHFMVNQQPLQDVFIRYIFRKRQVAFTLGTDTTDSDSTDRDTKPNMVLPDPMKVIHREQDAITAFCINQANLNCLSVATPKEVLEIDIQHLLTPPRWLSDETEYDIERIQNINPQSESDDFLVVQTPQDRQLAGEPETPTPSAPGVVPAPVYQTQQHMGKHGKHAVSGVRRMASHPNLPYYLTGCQDGSVRLWEWGHHDCITLARDPGAFPKVTRVHFSDHGNKFGASDGEGSLCLWQVGLGVNMNKPYLSLKCHSKVTSDFVFVGSASLLGTSGQSADCHNVSLWDTLLPSRNSLVHSFTCHDGGSSSLLYCPQQQILISGGKKGDVCLLDLRQRQVQQVFQAHDSPIKCMAIHPEGHYFVTGSSEGNVRVWGLTAHKLLASFEGEHARGSLFRNLGTGVTQLSVGPQNHLYSCGADGSIKLRHLPFP